MSANLPKLIHAAANRLFSWKSRRDRNKVHIKASQATAPASIGRSLGGKVWLENILLAYDFWEDSVQRGNIDPDPPILQVLWVNTPEALPILAAYTYIS